MHTPICIDELGGRGVAVNVADGLGVIVTDGVNVGEGVSVGVVEIVGVGVSDAEILKVLVNASGPPPKLLFQLFITFG